MTDQEVWYRYVDAIYAPSLDEFDNPVGESTLTIQCQTYSVERHTPKGVWLNVFGTQRFVRNKAKKQFACPTKRLAAESYIARKEAQIRIYTTKLRQAHTGLRLIRQELGEE